MRAKQSFASLRSLLGAAQCRRAFKAPAKKRRDWSKMISRNWRNAAVSYAAAACRPDPQGAVSRLRILCLPKPPGRSFSRRAKHKKSILLFASLLTIPLARQGSLDAALLAGLQVIGVTLHFLDDVLLLYLPLESAQSIFQRFAFLNANLRQSSHLQTGLSASLSYFNFPLLYASGAIYSI